MALVGATLCAPLTWHQTLIVEILVRIFVIAALLTTVTGQLAAQQRAQRSWNPAIGIQGGFVRVEPTGGGGADHVDFFNVPGPGYVGGALTYGSIYVILPVATKLALEPSFMLSYVQASGNSALLTRLGLRGDYALNEHVYAAAGAHLLYMDDNSGTSGSQLFGHLAAGYRFRLGPTFGARIEANLSVADQSDVQQSVAAYGILFGLSTRMGGGAAAPARRAPAAGRWQTRFGFQGGITSMIQPEGPFNAVFWSAPVIGGSVTSLGATVASQPTLFVVFPVGKRAAIDAGFDLHRLQSSGTTSASANLSGRMLLAVTGNWYAAGGVNLNYIKSTGADGGIWSGANVGWGYEFPVAGVWRGRAELNFQAMKENEDLGAVAQNSVGLLFALTVPLK